VYGRKNASASGNPRTAAKTARKRPAGSWSGSTGAPVRHYRAL